MNGRSSSAWACERARHLVSVQLDGVLPEAERRELDRHLARCETCSAVATDMALVVAQVRSEPLLAADLPIARLPVPRRARHGRRALRMVAAGSALAAATVLGFVVASPHQPARQHAPRPPEVAQRTFEVGGTLRLDQLRAQMHGARTTGQAGPGRVGGRGVSL